MALSSYHIKPIEYQEAMSMIVSNHYLHRKAPCSYAFGLCDTGSNVVKGVVTYGKPASHSLCKGICGEGEASEVIELTRLWVSDDVPKNGESFLIGNTIKLVPQDIIVSYAEQQQGHLGIVYQATNWIYTGMSDKHVQWQVEGMDSKHSRHLFDQYGGINGAKKALGDKMVATQRPRKYRYIYFNCNKRRKRELMDKLRYPILPYPKREE